jgi:hypothetical protein
MDDSLTPIVTAPVDFILSKVGLAAIDVNEAAASIKPNQNPEFPFL